MKENSKTYTALTIGPIYRTISQARKTRELWGASYMFSYVMRKIIEGLGDTSKCCLPYHKDMLNLAKSKGAGLFPDRLIYEGDVRAKIKTVSEEVISKISDVSGLPNEYLQHYFRINSIVFTLPQEIPLTIDAINKTTTDKNLVFIADKLLDATELHEKNFDEITNIDWKLAIDKLNGKIFYKEAFTGKDNSFKFPSIPEIATDDFRRKNKNAYYTLVNQILYKPSQSNETTEEIEENNQRDFLNSLKSNTNFSPIKLRPYHKYIAVVQADGDNIGQTIRTIGENPDDVKNFSSALFEFDIEAARLIKEYGGKSVYVGGDDLLFFAPVAVYAERPKQPNERETNLSFLDTIFSLLSKLDVAFEDKVINSQSLKHLYQSGGSLESIKPTMSYGISITYSKYPLNEAREKAYTNLMKAKEIKNDKNKICFSVQKHSGQTFGFTIDKKKISTVNNTPGSFNQFMKMVNSIPVIEGEKLLTSIIYKLAPLHALLVRIAQDKQRLDTFFAQEFDIDKDITRMSQKEIAKKEFIESIVNFYYSLSNDFSADNKLLPANESDEEATNIGKLYSTLRFVKHLTDEDNEQ